MTSLSARAESGGTEVPEIMPARYDIVGTLPAAPLRRRRLRDFTEFWESMPHRQLRLLGRVYFNEFHAGDKTEARSPANPANKERFTKVAIGAGHESFYLSPRFLIKECGGALVSSAAGKEAHPGWLGYFRADGSAQYLSAPPRLSRAVKFSFPAA
ncbi:hypothetical protein MRX96_010319 [Rhipicephalus microplus]